MIKYKEVIEEIKVPEYIECDKCKTKYYYGTNDEMEIQEFTNINDIGGYSSIFGDGTFIKYNICQNCFYKWVKQ